MSEKLTIEEWLLDNKTLVHVIDIIREDLWTDEEIIEQVLDLYKRKRITFAYEGDHIHASPAKWTPQQWKLAQQKCDDPIYNNLYYRFLRSLYRQGFKKKELIRLRTVMRTIWERTKFIKPAWGFIRRKYITL